MKHIALIIVVISSFLTLGVKAQEGAAPANPPAAAGDAMSPAGDSASSKKVYPPHRNEWAVEIPFNWTELNYPWRQDLCSNDSITSLNWSDSQIEKRISEDKKLLLQFNKIENFNQLDTKSNLAPKSQSEVIGLLINYSRLGMVDEVAKVATTLSIFCPSPALAPQLCKDLQKIKITPGAFAMSIRDHFSYMKKEDLLKKLVAAKYLSEEATHVMIKCAKSESFGSKDSSAQPRVSH
jgi:hypothetical protein